MIPFVILVAFLNGGLNIINKMVNVRAKQVLGMANGTLINYLEGTALAFALSLLLGSGTWCSRSTWARYLWSTTWGVSLGLSL